VPDLQKDFLHLKRPSAGEPGSAVGESSNVGGIEAVMQSCTFTILGRLPGLNEVVNAARTHRMVGAKQKKHATSNCAWSIITQRVPIFNTPVNVSFTWFEKDGRRDVDNITVGAKFILDALVATGRIKNDGRKYVRSVNHSFPEPDKKNPRILVTLYGIDEEN
jgi:Holliday junction resolvase RusA-like endonuclease